MSYDTYRVKLRGSTYAFSRDHTGAGYWTFTGARQVGNSIPGIIVHVQLGHELSQAAVKQGLGKARDFLYAPPRIERQKVVRVKRPRNQQKKSTLMGAFNPFDKTNIKTDEDDLAEADTDGAKIITVRRKTERKGFFASLFGDAEASIEEEEEEDEEDDSTEEIEIEEIGPELGRDWSEAV